MFTPFKDKFGDGTDGAALGTPARLVTAAMNFGLTVYATLTATAISLLHCVHVPGTPIGSRRLFIRGSVECEFGGWQWPYVLLVVVLMVPPVALPFVAVWARRTSWRTHELLTGSNPEVVPRLRDHVRAGLRRALVEAYTERRCWWEAVLMGQRLVGVSLWEGGGTLLTPGQRGMGDRGVSPPPTTVPWPIPAAP
jgi:hypothetical protein